MMKKRVCILGLGTIGFPLACLTALAGYAVLGVDIDQGRVDELLSADLISHEPDLEQAFRSAIAQHQLSVSTAVLPSDIYVIAVPTRIVSDHKPDLSHLHAAVSSLKPVLKSTDLVIIESTCPIGTTDSISGQLRAHCPRVSVAYCPERVLPGRILHELVHNDRVIGGVDERSTHLAKVFYQSIVNGELWSADARTAEAVKLAENTYRDVNIAFANELSMMAEGLNLNVAEVIRLANKHPRVSILNPGPGVGGYCIPTNPQFLASSAPELALLTRTARSVNSRKTEWVIQQIKNEVRKHGVKAVACLGLTYKADTADTRASPALSIVEQLDKDGINIIRVDPYVADTSSLESALNSAEMCVGLVAHKAFCRIPKALLQGKILLDYAGVFEA